MTHHLDIYVDRNWKTIGPDDPRHPRYGQPQVNEPIPPWIQRFKRTDPTGLLLAKWVRDLAPEKPQDEPETKAD